MKIEYLRQFSYEGDTYGVNLSIQIQMNPKLKKLSFYSASAITFLVLKESGNAQVVYKNIDPDIDIGDLNYFHLDFNEDGIIDLEIDINTFIDGHYDTTYYGDYEFDKTYSRNQFSINNFDAVINNPLLPAQFGAEPLSEGVVIGPASDWNISNSIDLVNFRSEFNNFEFDYSNWLSEDNYLGIRFLIDGNFHYGWVRLSFSNNDSYQPNRHHLFIHDYAYEISPNIPIIIDKPSASMAKNLVLFDVGETNTASDLKLTFTKAFDESKVKEYKIFLYDIYEEEMPTIEELENYTDLYSITVLPNGADQTIHFNPSDFDISGNTITDNITYKAIILSVPDGINVQSSDISLVSNSVSIEQYYAPNVNFLTLSQTDTTCNLSDFEVSFTTEDINTGIGEFRVFITNTDYFGSIKDLSSDYYLTVYPNPEHSYNIKIPNDLKIYEDIVPILFQNYEARVITMPDNEYTSFARITESYGTNLVCTVIEMNPIVVDDRNNGGSEDIRVIFNGYSPDDLIDYYKVAVVKKSSLAKFTIEKAKSLTGATYQKVLPGQNNYDFHLKEFLKDSDYDLIVPGIDYVVVICLVGDYNGMTISKPSTTVRLDSFDRTSMIFNNNLLYITEGVFEKSYLNIYNVLGQVVLQQDILYGELEIDLNFLTKGMYFVTLENPIDRKVVSIEIIH